MLVRVEQTRPWRGTRRGAATAGTDESAWLAPLRVPSGPRATPRVAKDCIQLLGGIGFTWEHDAHLYLRRAMAHARNCSVRPRPTRPRWWTLAFRGVRRALMTDLPEEAEQVPASGWHPRSSRSSGDWTAPNGPWALVDAGLAVPHWPSPWGRDATAIEQLVIDEEFADARHHAPPHLGVGAGPLPVIHPATARRSRRAGGAAPHPPSVR